MALENKITKLNDYFIGSVLEFDLITRKVAAHIPKLMPAISNDSPYSLESPTSSSVNISGVEYSNTITTRNSFWVSSWNVDNPMPTVGSKVAIFFIDGNPKNGFWVPFNSNGMYDVVDSEKYKELYTLQIGDRTVTINEEDKVQFTIPNSVSVVYNEEDKTKRINLIFTENYIISDTAPAIPFDGMMWYNSETKILSIYKDLVFRPIITEADENFETTRSITKIFSYNDITAAWLRIAELDPYIHRFNNAILDINTYNKIDGKLIPMSSSIVQLTSDFQNKSIPYSINALYNVNQGYLPILSDEMARITYPAASIYLRIGLFSSTSSSLSVRTVVFDRSLSLTAYHAIPFSLDFTKETYSLSTSVKNLSNVLLEEVVLPATIKAFHENALIYCYSLKSLTCEAVIPPIFPFKNTRDLLLLEHIYVPETQLTWKYLDNIAFRSSHLSSIFPGSLYVNTSTGLWDQGVSVPVAQPGAPIEGSMWFDESNDTLFVYTSGTWDTGTVLPVAQPSSPANGARWFNETTDKLYTYSFFLNQGLMELISLDPITWVEKTNVTTGLIAPETPPITEGDYYIDTSSSKVYIAVLGGVEGYQKANGWSYFASIISSIPEEE